MALIRSEFFKNTLTKIFQSTGLVNDVTNKDQMKAFVRAAKIDAAVNVHNWNNIIYPAIRTLRSSPEHEYDVLDSEKGGISGWTVTTEPWATENGMECLWDYTRGQPHSITGTIMCLASQLEALKEDKSTSEEYDDTELRSLIQCIDLNMGQLKKDTLAECYTYDCDGKSNLQYSMARHVYEIMSQLVVGGPSFGLESCFTDAYPDLSLEIRVSDFIYDALIPASAIEYCGEGYLLSDALTNIHNFVGQANCLDDSPNYSSAVPTGPGAGNNLISNGDSLVAAIKQIDRDLHSTKEYSLSSTSGILIGSTNITMDVPNDTLNLLAGDNIKFTAGVKDLEISVYGLELDDLVDVDAAAPNDQDVLRFDSSTSTWIPSAVDEAKPVFSIWLRPTDFDQRSAQQMPVTNTDLSVDEEPAGTPLLTPIDNSIPNQEYTKSLHNNNTVVRATRELKPGIGPGLATDLWYAHNAVQFTFKTGMAESDQLVYATIGIPRVKTSAGWEYPSKMQVTGYFFTDREISPGAWAASPSNTFTFSLTSHQDPSGAAGTIAPFTDGLQLTQLNFNSSSDPSGYTTATSNHSALDYRVCVLEFGNLNITAMPDMNGFLTLRMSPIHGTGYFNGGTAVKVFMLGLRVDFLE